MKRLSVCCVLAASFAGFVHAQTPARAPSYVASPMRRTVDDTNRSTGFRPGSFVMNGGTIRSIFQLAYPSEAAEPIGAPAWMMTDRYDLLVRFETERPTSAELQAIFREIFATQLKLKAHYERRETPTYSLVPARSDGRLAPGVRKLDVDCDARREAARRDKTGLDGFYEFSLKWASGPAAATASPDTPNIFTAFQEQLGLKLEPSTTAVEVVVIDQIERPQAP